MIFNSKAFQRTWRKGRMSHPYMPKWLGNTQSSFLVPNPTLGLGQEGNYLRKLLLIINYGA